MHSFGCASKICVIYHNRKDLMITLPRTFCSHFVACCVLLCSFLVQLRCGRRFCAFGHRTAPPSRRLFTAWEFIAGTLPLGRCLLACVSATAAVRLGPLNATHSWVAANPSNTCMLPIGSDWLRIQSSHCQRCCSLRRSPFNRCSRL